ncbi:uncharacterized protein EI90DRAFT_3047708 [Cantharellus anzutake]|uniref:uncharacterized protein n=1 Tax=Cantharellus anzutake TaxID=1750568 RepID=UPI00190509AC|nr:uncharacterized protein EI90DRAFT_3047708 [Cantharellus anzutake]KAF8335966.1 hypothetical protein EI90DRAFT_3047708 [Cantharellus anzutake]
MSQNEEMEVDSIARRSALLRPSPDLRNNQLETATVNMESFRSTFRNNTRWGGDDQSWTPLLRTLLSVLLLALSAAGFEDVQSPERADSIVDSFSDTERRECKDVAMKVLNDGDWPLLIKHLGPRIRRDGGREASPSGMAKNENPTDWTTFQSFAREYVGSHHSLLLGTLDGYCSRNIRPYNRSITIIQSSGCGKSRLMDKVAEERFAFPLNIGESLQKSVETYPPADEDVRKFLLPQVTDTNDSLHVKYACFLIQMFHTARPIVRSFRLKAHSRIAKRWRAYLAEGQSFREMGPNRKKFYGDVINRAMDLMRSVSPEAGGVSRTSSVGARFPTLQAQLADAIKLLELALYPGPGTPPSKKDDWDHCAFFLYIDGAHNLVEELGPGSGLRDRSAYHAFGRVLSRVNHLPFFTLFLSTNAESRPLAPKVAVHPSARDWEKEELPPYTLLPFDIFSAGQCAALDRGDSLITLAAACSSGNLVRFGRPLWYSMYENLQETTENIFTFAVKKLNPMGDKGFRSQCKDETSNETDASAMLASLDIRIHLSFDVAREAARSKISTLVQTYMRIIYAVSEHHEFIYSGYPSEPVLAEAAARLLNREGPIGSGAPLPPIAFKGPDILKAAYGEGILNRGERGETVGRLLMTIAHDAVIMRDNPLYEFEPVYHVPIKVLDFLQCLFHKSHHQAIFHALPVAAQEGAKTLQSAYENAYISFSHFAQLGDSKATRVEYLSKILLRGAAVNCDAQQSPVDFVIPILLGGPEQPINRKVTSALQVLINNRKYIPPGDALVNPRVTSPDPDVPVLSLILELGTQASFVDVRSCETQSDHRSPDDNHYLIVARGCSSETYSVIPPEYDTKYSYLLRDLVLLGDFARKRNIRQVLQQKPAFYGEKGESWIW